MRRPTRTTVALFAVMLVLALGKESVSAEEPMLRVPNRPPLSVTNYEEITDGERVELVAREWNVPGGLLLESTSSTGDRHVVLVSEELLTQTWRFEAGASDTEVTATRRDDGRRSEVAVAGRVDGEPKDDRFALGDVPWLQSIERSLRQFVLTGDKRDRVRFQIVQPDNLASRTLEARLMGTEERAVAGVPTTVRRVRIGLPGIGAIIWSSDYWFRASDGLFVESHVTRGPPGTPETVVRLIEDAADG